jgi:hypothetical protein
LIALIATSGKDYAPQANGIPYEKGASWWHPITVLIKMK